MSVFELFCFEYLLFSRNCVSSQCLHLEKAFEIVSASTYRSLILTSRECQKAEGELRSSERYSQFLRKYGVQLFELDVYFDPQLLFCLIGKLLELFLAAETRQCEFSKISCYLHFPRFSSSFFSLTEVLISVAKLSIDSLLPVSDFFFEEASVQFLVVESVKSKRDSQHKLFLHTLIFKPTLLINRRRDLFRIGLNITLYVVKEILRKLFSLFLLELEF